MHVFFKVATETGGHHPHDAISRRQLHHMGDVVERSMEAKLEPMIPNFAESGFWTTFIIWKVEK